MRSKPIVTRALADEDIDLAFEYYLAEGGPEVAVAFIDDYESSTAHISRFPLGGSPRLAGALDISDLRQWPLRRFPYSIIYIDRKQYVEVWRVLHSQRDLRGLLSDEG